MELDTKPKGGVIMSQEVKIISLATKPKISLEPFSVRKLEKNYPGIPTLDAIEAEKKRRQTAAVEIIEVKSK
jgi:hypothetical protein